MTTFPLTFSQSGTSSSSKRSRGSFPTKISLPLSGGGPSQPGGGPPYLLWPFSWGENNCDNSNTQVNVHTEITSRTKQKHKWLWWPQGWTKHCTNPQTYAAFLQMERKEFFHFHHMMVPLYYIQKTDKDNQTRYTVRISGYSGWILWIWILWTSDTEFQSQISQVRVNLSVSIP